MQKHIHLAVFGAHAMDAEVMAGGLIAKLCETGHQATIVHMTRGERGHPDKESKEFGRQLQEEMEKAACILGADVRWLGYKGGDLPICDEVSEAVIETVMKIRPTHIITHWRGSWHPRHVSTHYNVLYAIEGLTRSRSTSLPSEVTSLCYGENCEDLAGFNVMWYADISEVMDTWVKALSSYELYRLSRKGDKRIIPYSK